MTVLVTGGTGFLGRAVCRQFVEAGHQVRSLSRNPDPELAELGVEQHQGDLRDPTAVHRAVAGCAAVVHTAAKAGLWGRREEFYDINVRGTEHVVAACRAHDVPALVHTSSASVVFGGDDLTGADETTPYPDRYLAHYPWSKALAEKVVRAADSGHLATVILRPHLIWGPGDPHFMPRLLRIARRGVPLVGDGENRVDTIHIDNAAEAHGLALRLLTESPQLGGHTYFISQDEPTPLRQMMADLLSAAGVEARFRRVPAPAAHLAGGAMELLWRLLPGEPPLTRFLVAELATSHWFDIGAAKRDLGYSPTISTPQGLALLADALRNPDTHDTKKKGTTP